MTLAAFTMLQDAEPTCVCARLVEPEGLVLVLLARVLLPRVVRAVAIVELEPARLTATVGRPVLALVELRVAVLAGLVRDNAEAEVEAFRGVLRAKAEAGREEVVEEARGLLVVVMAEGAVLEVGTNEPPLLPRFSTEGLATWVSEAGRLFAMGPSSSGPFRFLDPAFSMPSRSLCINAGFPTTP
jgi:hypothetical protein